MPSSSGRQWIIYAENGLVEYWGYTPLEKENWYYFTFIHSHQEKDKKALIKTGEKDNGTV